MLEPTVDSTRGIELARQALDLARSLGDKRRQADALNLLAWDHRDFKFAFRYWEEAITLYRQVGHWSRLAQALSQFGFFLLMDGQPDAAHKSMDEANSLFQKLDIKERSDLLNGLGQIALMGGDYPQARVYFQEAARVSNELRNPIDYLWATSRLGHAELMAGNISRARQIFNEVLHSFQQAGNEIGVVFALEGILILHTTLGKAEIAARLIGWTDTTREKIKDTRPKLEQANMDKMVAACRTAMGEEAYADAYKKGSKLTLNEAVHLALRE